MHRPVPLAVLALVVVAGCRHTPVAPAPAPQVAADDGAGRARADSIAAADRMRQDSLARASADARRREAEEGRLTRIRMALQDTLAQRIHFDFERAEIRPGDILVLERKLAILQANPTVTLRVAGNCDERGSEEYNLVLGNRRALAARQYLMSHGIAPERITTVSNGKERPLVAGNDEASWAANRRDDFETLQGAESLTPPMAGR